MPSTRENSKTPNTVSYFTDVFRFFPSVVYLSTSKLSVAVLGNMAFAIALCLYRLITKLFLGTLRDAEIERLNERVNSAIMETCLAMTIFREEFNVVFVVMFAMVTFVKVFHWSVQERVDYIEITPHISRMQHLRILSFMFILLATDIQLFEYTVHKVIQSRGRTVMLLFAFEYLIQTTVIASSLAKYTLASLDSLLEGRWESKGVYVFYLELLTDMVHLCVYLIFFGIILFQYGLPVHLIRDLYWTIRNFRNRVRDFLRYRRVTSRMDLFPDATEEDLARCDNVCIICREEMSTATINKKLPCTHVFHVHCLRSWLERQQNCPICRNPVFPPRDRTAQPRIQPDRQEREGDQLQNVPALLQNLNDGDVAAPPAQQNQGDQSQGQALGDERGTTRVSAQQPVPDPSNLPQAEQQPVPLQPQLPLQWNGQQVGVMWNYPNMLPMTSMATFANGQIQYAGQQNPEPVMNHVQQGLSGVPFVPVMSSFSAPITLMAPPGSTPEHPRMAAAAAVAAAAYSPYTGLVMMPPVTYIPQSGSSNETQNRDTTSSAAQAAAAASAASGVAAAFSGMPPFNIGEQSSMEATVESVQRQLEFLQAQMTRGDLSSQSMPAATRTVAENPSSHQLRPEAFSADANNVPSVSSMLADVATPVVTNSVVTTSVPTVPSLPVNVTEPVMSEPPIQDMPPATDSQLSASELRQRRVQKLDKQE